MQIDASGFIPSKISCQNPVQCYILMYITTARLSSLSLFSLWSFFLMIFPNLYNYNHIPDSGKTLRWKLTLRYESMLFAHSRSGQKEGLLTVCSTEFKIVKKYLEKQNIKKKNWINEAVLKQTEKKAELLPCSLHERKEGEGRRGKGVRRKQTEVRGRIQRMGRREESGFVWSRNSTRAWCNGERQDSCKRLHTSSVLRTQTCWKLPAGFYRNFSVKVEDDQKGQT